MSFLFFGALFVSSTSQANAQVVINEFVPDASPEWVEFNNASDSGEYLKSYYVDDDEDFNSDSGSSPKKILTNLNISNIKYPYVELTSSIFNNTGDWVVLFDPLGNVVDKYHYNSNPGSGISIGRYPDGTGNFVVLAHATEGLSNSEPLATPTLSPTLTPTPSPTSTPTVIPTPTPTPTPVKTPIPTSIQKAPVFTPKPTGSSPSVLAAREELKPSFTPTVIAEKVESKNKFPVAAGILVVAGIIFVGLATLPFIRMRLKGYNEKHGSGRVEEETS